MTPIVGTAIHLRTGLGGAGNGNYYAADSNTGTGNNSATTAPFGTGAAATVRLKPLVAGTTAAVPAANTAPAGVGWWVIPNLAANPGSFQDMNDTQYSTRTIPSGTWTFRASVGQNATASTSLTVTAIFYKMTSTTAGTEIGRCSFTVTPALGAETAGSATVSIAAQTLTNGQTIAVELYMAGTGLAVTGNTGTFFTESTTNSGYPSITFPGNITATIAEPSTGGATTLQGGGSTTKRVAVAKGTVGGATTLVGGGTKAIAVGKGLTGGATSLTGGGHYSVVTYVISGVTRNDNNNTILGGATIKLFNASDVLQQTVTSNSTTGVYSFNVAASFTGWVSAYLANYQGGADYFGRTANNLTPQVVTIQSA